MKSGEHNNVLWLEPETFKEKARLDSYQPKQDVKLFSQKAAGLRLATTLKEEFFATSPAYNKTVLWPEGLPQIPQYELPAEFNLNGIKPYDYQAEGVAWAMQYGSGIFRWVTGSGKSFAGSALAKLVGGKTLILCPKKVIATWVEELKKFLPEMAGRIFILGDKLGIPERANMLRLTSYIPECILVSNYQSFRLTAKKGRPRKVAIETSDEILDDETGKELNPTIVAFQEMGLKFDLLLCDESAEIKNTDTSLYRGLAKIHQAFARRFCLSAAPAPQTPADYIGQMAIVAHPVATGYATGGTWMTNNVIRENQKIVGFHNLGILHNAVDKFCHTVTFEDPRLQAILPDQRYLVDKTPMGEQQAEAYRKLSKELVDDLNALLTPRDASDTKEEFMNALKEAMEIDDEKEQEIAVTKALAKYGEISSKYGNASVVVKGILAKIQRLIQCTGGWLCGAIDEEKLAQAREANPLFNLEDLEPDQKKKFFLPPAEFPENPKMELLKMKLENQFGGDCDNSSGLHLFEPVVIIAKYIHEVEAIAKMAESIGRTTGQIRGGVTTDKLVKLLQDFREGRCDTLVLQSESGRYGLNLQTSRYIIFYSNSYSYNSRIQAEGRIRRVGSKHSKCFVYDILCENTIDELVRDVLRKRESLSNLIMKNPNVVETHEYNIVW